MAILAPLFASVGRFAGKVPIAALGWTTILLFGKVPDSKQGVLLLVALEGEASRGSQAGGTRRDGAARGPRRLAAAGPVLPDRRP